MARLLKTYDVEIKEMRDDGGRILISTPSVDRDRDRLFPDAQIDNYMKNPVVQYGHNYYQPWATIGKTNKLELTKKGIIADFDLRPPANDQDPQNIVLLLWTGEWIRTASVGFDPRVPGSSWEENEFGGRDFHGWELIEWSLVPVPANQDALRLAAKALVIDDDTGLSVPKEPDRPIIHIKLDDDDEPGDTEPANDADPESEPVDEPEPEPDTEPDTDDDTEPDTDTEDQLEQGTVAEIDRVLAQLEEQFA
jgi:hypothetical protein